MASAPLSILLVDDEPIIHQTVGDYLVAAGQKVTGVRHGHDAINAADNAEFDVALVDLRLPGMDGMAVVAALQERRPIMPIVIITGHGTMDTVVDALRRGVADFLSKPIKLLELDAVLAKCAQLRHLRQERSRLHGAIRGMQASPYGTAAASRFVGVSAATETVRKQIAQAVDAGCESILVTGETGCGKEVVAREIHRLAGGDDLPFIAVSCPAIPDSLMESELFGHMKGSFTGAAGDRAGCFELADGGTLFLDEVADLSAPAQAALLRVLETRDLRRVGGARTIHVDVRVVAATNSPLDQLVAARKFRRDLLYRLNVFAIELLPLRQRPQDIMPLAEHFLANYASRRGLEIPPFSEAAAVALTAYTFPGNARELRNIVERAAILSGGGSLDVPHLTLSATTTQTGATDATGGADERQRIIAALEKTRWNRRQAAAELHMPYSTLRYKLKSLSIT